MKASTEIPPRFSPLPIRYLFGVGFPVATTGLARLRGLAFLEEDEAGPGLLIPRCRSVHTFGMRFPIDVRFLDRSGDCLGVRSGVGPGRLVGHRQAVAVLESIQGVLPTFEGNVDPVGHGGRERAGPD